ncbi:hypothetical protein AYI69_g9009 [Smittium culicis]|uniref:Reverse transcriptase domain-containing protein n=1 Tax=Smittium culicis TaxID=133412 RepID=A0A1R1XFM3_9FUNG|nr:hypothetical protein AYI69_g9009 [Smittium culicis]
MEKYTTGNIRDPSKLLTLLNDDSCYFPERDHSISWADIATALNDTPNSKAPEADWVQMRHGCSASPILFDLFIKDILKNFIGVEVPGIHNRIPGLLFANESVVLAESAINLKTSLDAITVWSDTWEMAVNASKCAIMAVNCDDPAELTLQRKTIRTTEQYTYLGYIMNGKWGCT